MSRPKSKEMDLTVGNPFWSLLMVLPVDSVSALANGVVQRTKKACAKVLLYPHCSVLFLP